MNNMPSVVMNEGMPNRSVTKPLIKPMPTAVASAAQTASASGAPLTQLSTIM